jgi:hypothetical protein
MSTTTPTPISVNSGREPLKGIRKVVRSSIDVAGSTGRGLVKKASNSTEDTHLLSSRCYER